ncbi:hypothetical protein B566_EDAN003477 [Ephemera danica]|nr:hypothetical protein B566_EDAN003477 [Ephemera danica]
MLANDYCNVYSDSITSQNMDNNRNCIRRVMSCHDESEFSAQSILRAMEKFVKAVNDMDETILIPCRLMDMKVCDEETGKEPSKHKRKLAKELNNSDLYSVYTMINSVKNELLWGQTQGQTQGETQQVEETTTQVKGHIRRPSTVSVTSTNSTASSSASSAASTTSDTDSETGIENDSGVDGECEDYTQVVSDKFRRHLHGLYHCLDNMTEAASYLTARYQSDIGGAV